MKQLKSYKKEIFSCISLIFLSFSLCLILPFNLGMFVYNGNLDSTTKSWGFEKNIGSFPVIPEKMSTSIGENNAIWRGSEKEKVMYLTFDGGYEAGYTAGMLDTLKEKAVPATFFIVGHYINEEPDLVKRMVAEGHIIGNHTENHISMPKSSDSKISQEINKLNDKYKRVTGSKKNMKYLRPPSGEYSNKSLFLTNELGYKTVFWSIAYVDWERNAQPAPANAIKKVTGQFHNGAIILLHSTSETNSKILSDIIDTAKAQGYTFKSLDEFK